MSSMRKQSLIATAAIFCCRFTGLLREVCFTSFFGATGALDAFLTAFRIPNMLRDMFAEGALSQSFTSEMSKVEHAQGREQAWQLANRVCTQLMALMLCFVSIGVIASGFVMQQLYPEQAAIILQEDSQMKTAPGHANFIGEKLNADGVKELQFSCQQAPEDWQTGQFVALNKLPPLKAGESIELNATQIAGNIKIAPRNYMEMAAQLCRIMWPFILFASLVALAMGALNVFGIFGLPNLASAIFNLTTIGLGIGIGWWIDPQFGPDALYGFAIAILIGGLAQLLFLLPRLRKEGFKAHWDIGLTWAGGRPHFTSASVRKVWYMMLPGMIAAGITQFNIFINTSFALYLPGGSVTALSCAFHLWQLPVALFGVAVGMVVLPAVSRMKTADGSGHQEIAHHLALAIRFLIFFALPSTIFLGLWGEEIVSIFYQRGRFDAQSSAFTGQVLTAYSLGLMSYAGTKVLQPVFLALERPWPPAILALLCCCVSISLNYIFVHQLHLSAPWLALTTSIVTTLNFAFYFIYLRHLLGGMDLRTLLPGLVRIFLAGTVLGIVCYILKQNLMQDFTSWSFWGRLGMMSILGLVAASIYLAASALFRVPELMDLLHKVKKRKA